MSYLAVKKLLEKKNKAKQMWKNILDYCISNTAQTLRWMNSKLH